MGISLPPNFKAEPTTLTEYKLVSITLGWSLAFALLTGTKAVRQTYGILKRTRNWRNLYVWLIWIELLDNVVFSVYDYSMQAGNVKFGFTFCMIIITLWVLQVQILPQIILNRISLLAVDKKKIRRLKITVLLVVAVINVSVYCVWIPAHMQISPEIIKANQIWDRIEKVIYAIIDLSLNIYFLYLVRTKLISAGLTKYNRLFWFNAGIVWVSIAMDVMIIGMMSLSNDNLYGQFHPIAYLAKLHIEMTMADLIAKVASASQRSSLSLHGQYGTDSEKTWPSSSSSFSSGKSEAKVWASIDEGRKESKFQLSPSNELIEVEDPGIKKTVSTKVSFSTPWRHAGEVV